jgi:hypothetical protein
MPNNLRPGRSLGRARATPGAQDAANDRTIHNHVPDNCTSTIIRTRDDGNVEIENRYTDDFEMTTPRQAEHL